jgi:hypothetical protein
MPGLSPTAAGEMLTTFKGKYVWLQLHDGDPGANGTANIADETERKQVTWPASVTTQTMTNTNTLTWTDVEVAAGEQDYVNATLWSAATGGVFGASGLVTANPVNDGDGFEVAPGGVTVNLPVTS